MAAHPWRSACRVGVLVVALAGIAACDPDRGAPTAAAPAASASSSAAPGKSGADVTCGEYLEQNPDLQRQTVAKVIKEYNNGQEPDPAFVDFSRGGVDLICFMPSNVGLRVSDAVHQHVKIQIGPTR